MPGTNASNVMAKLQKPPGSDPGHPRNSLATWSLCRWGIILCAPTAQGSALHLMALSGATARTARPRLQVHRSWRLARDAVSTLLRDGRSVRLKLLNGLEVPVARRSVTHLKAAAWRRIERPAQLFAHRVQSQKIQLRCDSLSGCCACWRFPNRVNDSP
jgi:hypothetical protein